MVPVAPAEYDVVVLDAEPLVAYFLDSPGADVVEEFLVAVEKGEADGRLSGVTMAETLYVCTRSSDHETARRYLETLGENGFQTAAPERCWSTAGQIKTEYAIALGDAFALATARDVDADRTLLVVGGDADFDPFVGREREDGPDIVRFREGQD